MRGLDLTPKDIKIKIVQEEKKKPYQGKSVYLNLCSKFIYK
jgi:hypothetical protein